MPAAAPVRWADLSGYSTDAFLISQVAWWPDSSAATACIQDRVQTWLDLVKIPAEDPSPKPQRLFRETHRGLDRRPRSDHVPQGWLVPLD